MTAQVEVQFQTPPPKGRTMWSGPEARAYASVLIGGTAPPLLFHKNDDLSASTALSLVRWGGGKDSFRLVGIGPEAIAAVHGSTFPLVAALSAATNRAVPIRVISTEAQASLRPYKASFTARSLVVTGANTASARAFFSRDAEARKAWIADSIRKTIARQKQSMTELSGDEDSLDLATAAIDNIVISDPHTQRLPGAANRFVTHVDVRFTSDLELNGSWAAGFMTHLGFGRIAQDDAYNGGFEVRYTDLPDDSPDSPIYQLRARLNPEARRVRRPR